MRLAPGATGALLGLVVLALLVAGCVSNRAYRTDLAGCDYAERQCADSAWQSFSGPGGEGYRLGFVEFDDQGQLFDRAQMHRLLDRLYGMAAREPLVISVFVHGWHHNAAPEDSNIRLFRHSLRHLSRLEQTRASMSARLPRRVVGVYVGWRGESVSLSGLNTLTFWGRKSAAQRVGRGGVGELLARLEQLRRLEDRRERPGMAGTRMVVVGHSFGGALVYNALSRTLVQRFVDTRGPLGVSSDVRGFADLTVLINPAFEAGQFATLADMARERRTYFDTQAPVLAVLTSEADWATGYAFPLGRFFSTAFDAHRSIERVNPVTGKSLALSQGKADRVALGHYEPYLSHRLVPDPALANARTETVLSSIDAAWRSDRPGGAIRFPGTRLEHLERTVARNPYLNIRVSPEIIPDHNDIDDPRVVDFLAHLIHFSMEMQR